jgi:hypothetical protein
MQVPWSPSQAGRRPLAELDTTSQAVAPCSSRAVATRAPLKGGRTDPSEARACLCGVLFALTITGSIDAGTLLVALATLVLAAVTWRLAHSTAESVRAAQSSAEAERLSIEAMAMPYVVIQPQERDKDILGLEGGSAEAPILSLHVRLLNIGSGPAIVSEVRLDSTQATTSLRHGRSILDGELLLAVPEDRTSSGGQVIDWSVIAGLGAIDLRTASSESMTS